MKEHTIEITFKNVNISHDLLKDLVLVALHKDRMLKDTFKSVEVTGGSYSKC